ncbi:DUF1348 family protein [Flavobacterium sp. UBA7682]|uniref:DUF1348 family protein n=1 Tax=Flavobacterium sp. UBA7682 TaxID=1946560 RepID=UPI0025C29A55|nr:DUF1348 family protein [Flavobacterium sp. UBA7682]
MSSLKKYPLPPFTMETALEKAVSLDVVWNGYLPETLGGICSTGVEWQDNLSHVHGLEAVHKLLHNSCEGVQSFKSQRTLWGFRVNRMAVRFVFEWQDHEGFWFRAAGNELLEFNEEGLLLKRFASSSNWIVTVDDLSV